MIPEASAISMTAVLPSPRIPYLAFVFSPKGPATQTVTYSPPNPSTRASVVPSPPSAKGFTVICASHALRMPLFAAYPASIELMLPLNESIAITTFILLTPPYPFSSIPKDLHPSYNI